VEAVARTKKKSWRLERQKLRDGEVSDEEE
jgi:hypothetical protein